MYKVPGWHQGGGAMYKVPGWHQGGGAMYKVPGWHQGGGANIKRHTRSDLVSKVCAYRPRYRVKRGMTFSLGVKRGVTKLGAVMPDVIRHLIKIRIVTYQSRTGQPGAGSAT